jgi:hypothetical protein
LRLPYDPRFQEQRAKYELRFTCEHCALFDAEKEQCAHGFPTEEHRLAFYAQPGGEIVICKDFQLE